VWWGKCFAYKVLGRERRRGKGRKGRSWGGGRKYKTLWEHLEGATNLIWIFPQ
jgi:hypothetical protein